MHEPDPTTSDLANDVPSAAHRVLLVGELVELILIHLSDESLSDVVQCRRVSKKFLETITYSRTLRRRLYLEGDQDRARAVNPLAPKWFGQQRNGYRDSTIAAKINITELWNDASAVIRPLWDRMLISQPPPKQCVIPVGNHLTIFFRREYPEGMTFSDLEKAVIAAFEIRKGRRYASRERLEELSSDNLVLIYWK